MPDDDARPTAAPEPGGGRPHDDPAIADAELAKCAKTNLAEIAKLVPDLRRYPAFALANEQLDGLAQRLLDRIDPDKRPNPDLLRCGEAVPCFRCQGRGIEPAFEPDG